MKKTIAAVSLALALAFGATACGGDDSLSEGDMDDLVDTLQSAMGIGEEEARCVADGMREEFGDERMVEFRDAGDDFTPSDSESAKLVEIITDCGAIDLGE